jgi:hypothetical protein
MGLTVIVKILLVIVTGTGQVVLEIISTFTWLPLTRVLVVNVELFDPTGIPATYHLNTGLLPPFIGVAVNVTEVPEHIGLTGFARIDTDGTEIVFTKKVSILVEVPKGVVIEIVPVVAVAGKIAVI